MRAEVIRIDDKHRWNSIISSSYRYDVYHCWSYHNLDECGQQILFVAFDDRENFIAIPLIIREIPHSTFKDCTSVYGYPGPVCNLLPNQITVSLKDYFQKSICEFFVKEKIVSVFSRLHPLIENDGFLSGLGKIVRLSSTIAIDVNLAESKQLEKIRKSVRYDIRQLRSSGFEIKQASSSDELQEFITIYHESMDRVNAKNAYYFPNNYFNNLLHADDFKSILLLAVKNGNIAAGGMFIVTDKIMQYHLAGSKTEYLKNGSMKLIIDDARRIATDLGLDYLHLGGGYNVNSNDSLFHFKAGFSDSRFDFSVWQLVVDERQYDRLEKKHARKNVINENFFPTYRC